MAKELSAKEARERFSELINLAGFAKERTVITKNGKGIAAVVSMEDLAILDALAFEQALTLSNDKFGRMLKNLAN